MRSELAVEIEGMKLAAAPRRSIVDDEDEEEEGKDGEEDEDEDKESEEEEADDVDAVDDEAWTPGGGATGGTAEGEEGWTEEEEELEDEDEDEDEDDADVGGWRDGDAPPWGADEDDDD